MSELTKAELAWAKKLERVLKNPPSERIGLFTIGDPNIYLYDKSKDEEINAIYDASRTKEFLVAVEEVNADLYSVDSATEIHSVAG